MYMVNDRNLQYFVTRLAVFDIIVMTNNCSYNVNERRVYKSSTWQTH